MCFNIVGDIMPAYKTHAIHGEIILPLIDKKTEINKEDLKVFCFGPDSLIATDSSVFESQHRNKVRVYFETLVRIIKKRKLQDNSEIMAFLYGQLDHYILDLTCHPLIYYMTEGLDQNYVMAPHTLMELWIDNYMMEKYGKKEVLYFHKWYLKDKQLRSLVDDVYKTVYGAKNEAYKYSLGISLTNLFDFLGRNNGIGIAPLVAKLFNIGDLTNKDSKKVLPYLNLEHKKWTDPVAGYELDTSFEDLWKKAFETSLETINNVNRYLYGDGKLSNHYINSNISYNTGVPCLKKQKEKFPFIKKKTY